LVGLKVIFTLLGLVFDIIVGSDIQTFNRLKAYFGCCEQAIHFETVIEMAKIDVYGINISAWIS
jgi:hypothetical protein